MSVKHTTYQNDGDGNMTVFQEDVVDETSIVEVNNNAIYVGNDYKDTRRVLKQLIEDKAGSDFSSWMLLSQEERSISCHWGISPVDKIQAMFPDTYNEILINWDNLSTDCRKRRWDLLKNYLFNGLDEAKEVISDIEKDGLRHSYIQGIEGSLEDAGIEGLFDYVEARVGTTYESTGLAASGYSPNNGQNITDFSNSCMNILTTGSL